MVGRVTGTRKKKKDRSALPVLLVLALLLVGTAGLIVRSQEQTKTALQERFRLRGAIGSRLVQSWSDQLIQRLARDGSQMLSAPTVRQDDLEDVVARLDVDVAFLLDATGRLIGAVPGWPELVGQEIASQNPHLIDALTGQIAISNVVPSVGTGEPVVVAAVPFQSGAGRRVLVGGFRAGSGPLVAFLTSVLPAIDSRTYLIDRENAIVASNRQAPAGIKLSTLEPRLARLIFGRERTSGADESLFFISEPVEGTPWRIVVTAPLSRLYEPLEGGATRRPWAIFTGFAAAALLAAILALRLVEERRRLVESNVELMRYEDELKRRLAEQERLNRTLDAFAGHVAHDLRNPLATMQMWAELLKRQEFEKLTGIGQEAVGTIDGAARRGVQLVDDLLDLARASATARREPVDLQDLVKDAAAGIEGVDVRLRFESREVVGDRVRLRQAVVNLLQNAARYARTDGAARVEVALEEDKRGWKITVEDEGPGLDPNEAERLFRPFERGRTTAEVKGTGLGLAIVAATADAHGGRAWYEPRPGGGSRFNILIPHTTPSAGDGQEPRPGADTLGTGR